MLEENKFLIKKNKHKTTVRLCSRSNDILEYRLKHQWYVNTEDMSQQSIEAVKTGKLKIIPDADGQHENTWYKFLGESRSWCISRQLWWGHRIPAYRIIHLDKDGDEKCNKDNEEWIVARSVVDAYIKASEKYPKKKLEIDYALRQDDDVLDTWFSSGIYPFSILQSKYFPLDVLETGKDILFFWVARMVMLSLALKKEIPFKTVYIHNIIRDKDGKKMSKSLGNIIDPLDIIHGVSRDDMEDRIKKSNLDKKEIIRALSNIKKNFPKGIDSYGVDSLRMGLIFYLRQGTDINLDVSIFKSCHALLNKLWNVLNMYKMLKDNETDLLTISEYSDTKKSQLDDLQTYIDVLSRTYLNYNLYERYDFAQLYENIHHYVMNNYCPFYLEALKYFGTNHKLLNYFQESFSKILYYLHPIAPNATDEMFFLLTDKHIHDDKYHQKSLGADLWHSLFCSDTAPCSRCSPHILDSSDDIVVNTVDTINVIDMTGNIMRKFGTIRKIIDHINLKLSSVNQGREIFIERDWFVNGSDEYIHMIECITRSTIIVP
jgi:valyl-tRNA synthetase